MLAIPNLFLSLSYGHLLLNLIVKCHQIAEPNTLYCFYSAFKRHIHYFICIILY